MKIFSTTPSAGVTLKYIWLWDPYIFLHHLFISILGCCLSALALQSHLAAILPSNLIIKISPTDTESFLLLLGSPRSVKSSCIFQQLPLDK